MPSVFNIFVIYQFLRILSTPWNKQKAFSLGIIDNKGNTLIKSKDQTPVQKKSATIFHRLIWNIKKLLGKLPGGKSRLAGYAAALYLVREEALKLGLPDKNLIEKKFIEYLKEQDRWEDSDVSLDEKFSSHFDPGFIDSGTYELHEDFMQYSKGDILTIEYTDYPTAVELGENMYSFVHKQTKDTVVLNSSLVREVYREAQTIKN